MNGLTLKNVSFYEKNKLILSNISLSLKPGKILCLIGPSGGGKTTLLRLIAGLEKLSRGKIFFNNKILSSETYSLDTNKRGIGLMFQDTSLFPHLDVNENILFGLSNLSKKEKLTRTKFIYSFLNLEKYKNYNPFMLSGGERQRVALARALAPGPKVMLLDEPFSSLDTHLRIKIAKLATYLLRKSNIATIIVTHDADEAMLLGDHIAILNKGKLIQKGKAEEVYKKPKNLTAARMFGFSYEIQAKVRNRKIICPLGNLDTPHLKEGSVAVIVVRPEALILGKGKEGKIIEKKVFGGKNIVMIDFGENWKNIHLTILGKIPEVGKGIKICFNKELVFAFPVEKE